MSPAQRTKSTRIATPNPIEQNTATQSNPHHPNTKSNQSGQSLAQSPLRVDTDTPMVRDSTYKSSPSDTATLVACLAIGLLATIIYASVPAVSSSYNTQRIALAANGSAFQAESAQRTSATVECPYQSATYTTNASPITTNQLCATPHLLNIPPPHVA